MGKVAYTVCDRCNKQINASPRILTRQSVWSFKWPALGGRRLTLDIELCQACHVSLDKFLKGEPINDN